MVTIKNKSLVYTIAILFFTTTIGCKKYLNINLDPANPQILSSSSIFPAMLSAIPRGIQWDAYFLGCYIQNWHYVTASNTWDRHGYASTSDLGGDIWRQTYVGLGPNLDYIIEDGIKKQQYDFVGAAYALKAFMFQTATDYHGEIIFTEAFKKNTYYFKYDSQQVVYEGVRSLCRTALQYFDMATAKGTNYLGSGDYVYKGAISQWKKFVYGILARNYGHLTNKGALYSADSVIMFCDKAMGAVADDFLISFNGSRNEDANYFGTFNTATTTSLVNLRQSNFIVKLLDGTILTGSSTPANRDPRMAHMLSASGDTTNGNGGYRGVDPAAGDPFNATTTGPAAEKRVATLWGDGTYSRTGANGKYLFQNKVAMPVMTYAEIQFIKAEAAFKKDNKPLAYTAYLNGINAHFDFVNRAGVYNGSPISNTARNAYLASSNVVQSSTNLTLKDIMLQKYIALWGWGFVETWVDLRKYHYASDTIYKGFVLPTPFAGDNSNKPAYRVRPRYNSEYVWNISELQRIGADKPDYHTYECWFSKP